MISGIVFPVVGTIKNGGSGVGVCVLSAAGLRYCEVNVNSPVSGSLSIAIPTTIPMSINLFLSQHPDNNKREIIPKNIFNVCSSPLLSYVLGCFGLLCEPCLSDFSQVID